MLFCFLVCFFCVSALFLIIMWRSCFVLILSDKTKETASAGLFCPGGGLFCSSTWMQDCSVKAGGTHRKAL